MPSKVFRLQSTSGYPLRFVRGQLRSEADSTKVEQWTPPPRRAFPPRSTECPHYTVHSGSRWRSWKRREVGISSIQSTARTSYSSRAATPHIARCELAPTTAVRLRAQVKYSKRFHAAYGHNRSRAGVPRSSSSPMSLPPRTDRPRDVEYPLTVTSLASPRRSHRRAIPSFSKHSPPTSNCAVHVPNVVGRCSRVAVGLSAVRRFLP